MPVVALACVVSLCLGACTDVGAVPDGSPARTSAGSDAGSGAITVYAAASLSDSFAAIGEEFESAHPGASVRFNFAGSSGLAQGIVSGAPVDVFAAASGATMAIVTDTGLASDPTVFARNSLQIAVPAGNPGNISGIADFANAAKTIAVCAPEVPCGAAAERAFRAAGVTPAPDSLEQDVAAAITRVELGEVDAAMVYRTDVLAAGDAVEGIDFAESDATTTDYLIAPLSDAPDPDTAAAFAAFVVGERAQAILAAAGFGAAGFGAAGVGAAGFGAAGFGAAGFGAAGQGLAG